MLHGLAAGLVRSWISLCHSAGPFRLATTGVVSWIPILLNTKYVMFHKSLAMHRVQKLLKNMVSVNSHAGMRLSHSQQAPIKNYLHDC